MSDPLAYFLTWTTYGSWLPGDERGWVDRQHRSGEAVDAARPLLEAHSRELLKGPAVVLDEAMRAAAETAIGGACGEYGWMVHALAVRTNHVHIVLTAREVSPGKAMGVLKQCGTKALDKMKDERPAPRWWTEDGSKRALYTEKAVCAAVEYVRNQ